MPEIVLNKETYPVDIVMVTWHRPEITEMAIKAIAKNTKRKNYRLIVIDNGSKQEMQEMLVRLQDEELIDNLILNEENIGLEPARTQSLDSLESEYFICADNDCLPPKIENGKDWVERLVELMENNPEYAAISCRTQVMIGTGNIFEDESKEITDFPHPGGSLRIMTVPTVLDVGGWRTDMVGRGSEERYICGKLREQGWKTGFATNIKCLHLFGDRSKNTDRWGYPIDWKPEDSGHSDIWHPVLGQGDDPEEVRQYYDGD